MRKSFVDELIKLAQKDKRIVLLTGDLGYTVLEPFAEKFSGRFYNVGVAEQNMIGVATGLAEAGYMPFVYSIATFVSLRPYEFIRNGPIWHKLPVRIVGIGDGLEYGSEGLSHYALEDVGIMRLQPGMTVVVPADAGQAKTALNKTWGLPGPIYYRISKRDMGPVPNLKGRFSLGKLQLIKSGRDVLFIVMGRLAHQAYLAAKNLAAKKISAGVAVVASVFPPPTAQLKRLIRNYKLVVTVEAHYITGGIGSLVAEVRAETGASCRILRCGVRQIPRIDTGKEAYLWKIHGLSAAELTKRVMSLFKS
jgi:transketolase